MANIQAVIIGLDAKTNSQFYAYQYAALAVIGAGILFTIGGGLHYLYRAARIGHSDKRK